MDPSIGRTREGGNRVSIGVRRIDWLKEDFSARRQTVSLDEARRTLVAASFSVTRLPAYRSWLYGKWWKTAKENYQESWISVWFKGCAFFLDFFLFSVIQKDAIKPRNHVVRWREENTLFAAAADMCSLSSFVL